MTNSLKFKKTSFVALSLAVSLAANSSWAEDDSGSAPTLVTDPTEIAAAGYSGSAAVYSNGDGHYFAAYNAANPAPKLFGPINEGSFTLQPADLQPADSNTQWVIPAPNGIGGGDVGDELRCPAGGEGEFLGSVHLPEGALITGFDVFGNDADAADRFAARLSSVCQDSAGVNDPTTTDLTTPLNTTALGAPGNFVLTENGINTTVSNHMCTYVVWVDLENISCGSALKFYKARVRWMRQISPAPAVATFTDVPTGHPFFKEVEAMVASGITGGLGGGLYGPDQNLTRGQMAAFLSRALGL